VQPELEQLLVLQNRDQKIKQISAEIKTIPQQRAQLEASLAAALAGLEAAKQRGRQLEVERKKLELDVGTRTESINRLKTQQYETRKNEEFRAMGNEIERYEKEIREIEDRELELMEQADQVRGQVAEEDKKAAGARDSVARQVQDLDAKAPHCSSSWRSCRRNAPRLSAAWMKRSWTCISGSSRASATPRLWASITKSAPAAT
jgi:predicted  nucleic acid-binding Zn-ribbon protein